MDDQKSESNKFKHGIDFYEARELWRSGVVEFPAPKATEIRYVAFGKLKQKLYLVAFTYRGHRRRIISAPLATEDELRRYANEEKRKTEGW